MNKLVGEINITPALPESPSESMSSEISGLLPRLTTGTFASTDGKVMRSRFREEFKRQSSFKLWMKKLVS